MNKIAGPTLEDGPLRLEQLPPPLKKEEYLERSELMGEACSKLPDILSLYQFGSIRAPGFSDLDFLIVMKDKPQSPEKINRLMESLQRNHGMFFTHPPQILPKRLLKKEQYIYPIFNAKLLFGEPSDLPQKTKEKEAATIFLNDIINTSTLRNHTQVFLEKQTISFVPNHPIFTLLFPQIMKSLSTKTRTIKTRDLINKLHNIRYEHSLYKTATKRDVKGIDSFIDRIDRFRTKWFTMDAKGRELELIDLFLKGYQHRLDLVESFATYLESENIAKINGTKGVSATNYPYINKFQKDWTKNSCFTKTEETYQRTGRIVNFLPLVLAVQLMFIPGRKSIIGQAMEKKINLSSIKFQHSFEKAIRERIKTIISHTSFLRRYGLKTPPFNLFGHIPPRHIILNKVYKV